MRPYREQSGKYLEQTGGESKIFFFSLKYLGNCFFCKEGSQENANTVVQLLSHTKSIYRSYIRCLIGALRYVM